MKTLYLVTGAAGYIGGEVCRQLVERGLHGRALVLPGNKTAQYIPREIGQCEGDLCVQPRWSAFSALRRTLKPSCALRQYGSTW